MSRHGLIPTLALALASACSSPGGTAADAPDFGFDRAGLLAHLSNDILLPLQLDFATKAAALPPAIQAHCDALDAGAAATTLDTARAAFAAAIDAWQRNEALLVGPAETNMSTLRGHIYGWPNTSPCEIDRDVASRWADPSSYDVSTELISTRSLTAVELLLYPPTDTHNCFDVPAGWDALGADLPRARCRLALAIATDVAAQANTLATDWRSDGGNYVAALATAGSNDTLPSTQHALNLVSDGIFYIDRMVKDMKLGEAAGIAVNACDAVEMPCLREVELRYSDRATFALRANLEITRQAFTGTTAAGEGLGFDDWLIAAGQPELAARMTASLDAAITKANALPDSFLGALDTQYADVAALHGSVRAFTDDLKSQFLTILALEIPDDVATDND